MNVWSKVETSRCKPTSFAPCQVNLDIQIKRWGKLQVACCQRFNFGDPAATRTRDRLLRRQMLYPAELPDLPFWHWQPGIGLSVCYYGCKCTVLKCHLQLWGGFCYYPMRLLPVISAGCFSPRMLSMVGATSARRPSATCASLLSVT